jgi:prevent-host-death family protein
MTYIMDKIDASPLPDWRDVMKIAIAEAKAQFAEIIRRAEAGEEIELTRYGRAVARVVGPKPEKRQALIGCMKGRFEAPRDIHDGDAEVAALFAASAVAPQ